MERDKRLQPVLLKGAQHKREVGAITLGPSKSTWFLGHMRQSTKSKKQCAVGWTILTLPLIHRVTSSSVHFTNPLASFEDAQMAFDSNPSQRHQPLDTLSHLT